MIELDGEVYHNAASAARYLRITRFMFYYNIKARCNSTREKEVIGCSTSNLS